ncbi:hypothetical protein PR048_021035 [Dryococelus australis]|uniref:Uncharacterized protein n=1 Tax=Dryococelus australis TaxID=614101 RepID=A0ABQ9GX37_9NEOP|nr:hypothetical protein PR048_021035 [Dryococelus australis]
MSDFNLERRRVVDINSFVRQIQEIDSHEPFNCCFKEMFPVYETHRVKNNLINVDGVAVSRTLSTGGEQAQLEEITSILNIPAMSYNLFQKYPKNIDDWEETAFSEIEKNLYNLKLRKQ